MSYRPKPSILARRGSVVALALCLAACSKAPPTAPPVRAVKVITVGMEDLSLQPEYAGEVRARVETRLGFRVPGKLTQRLVDAGQTVKAGQLMAVIDAQDFQLATDAARAQLAAAKTNMELAGADFNRYRGLQQQNFISGAELERRESIYKAAQAQFESAQAQLSSQRNQTEYTRLVAPAAGVITAVEAEAGQVLGVGASVFRLALDGPRDVVFSVQEDKVRRLALGSEVQVRGWASTSVIQGRVREVSASADPATRTYLVKVAVPSAQAPPLGATVYLRPTSLGAGGARAIKLPTSALRQEGQGSAVWVLDRSSMTVQLRAVQVATADGNDAVITAGLEPGTDVVSAGVHVLTPGEKVTVYGAAAAPASPAASPPASAAAR